VERLPLESRAIASAGYDAETRVLELEFSSGRVYRFREVPAGVYEWLLRVPKKGLYVSRSVTSQYAFEDVTDQPTAEEPADLESLLERSLRS
jgi:hypothetical protein